MCCAWRYSSLFFHFSHAVGITLSPCPRFLPGGGDCFSRKKETGGQEARVQMIASKRSHSIPCTAVSALREMDIRVMPVLANTQLKASSVSLIFRMCHIAPQNGLFGLAKPAVSGGETPLFGCLNGASRNLLYVKWLAWMPAAVAFNIKKLIAERCCRWPQGVWAV